MTSILDLAVRLSALDAEGLRELIDARRIMQRGIDDYFDLAERLLGEASVQDALSRLDRGTLAVLGLVADGFSGATAAELADRVAAAQDRSGAGTAAIREQTPAPERTRARIARLRRLQLLVTTDGDRVTGYPEVGDVLLSWPARGLPSPTQLLEGVGPGLIEVVRDRDSAAVDRLATERAFTTTAHTTELLSGLARQPARELARGGLSLPDSKRLATALGVEHDDIPPLLEIARHADLVALDGTLWRPTVKAEQWLQNSTAERWARLADAWLGELTPEVRAVLASPHAPVSAQALDDYLTWLYPAGGEALVTRLAGFRYGADLLGLTAEGTVSSPGSRLLAGRATDAVAQMTERFPAEVERVYLQHDLSVISPGPLSPGIDSRLRGMSVVESRAHASTYRFSAGSIRSALTTDETAESILAFLAGISLTGVPQPLEYLVTETASRLGLIRVGRLADQPGAHSYITSADGALLRTIAVDRTVSWLGLDWVDEQRLHSRFDRDSVLFALLDSGYPAAAEDEHHAIVPVQRVRVIADRAPEPAGADSASALVHRLLAGRHGSREESMRAWLVRQLEASVRARSLLLVTVGLADGSVVDYLLEPVGVFGGRLRGLDRALDLERTLPVSRIVGLRPAEAPSRNG